MDSYITYSPHGMGINRRGDYMNKMWLSIPALFIGAIFLIQSTDAHPYDNATKQKDSIEWVALWSFPISREEQLERMLTTELQRKTLWALQEKEYLKTGKEHVYCFDPFQVTNMRQVEGGFYELDIMATIHEVINAEIDKNFEKYKITFRHNYETGFIVTKVIQL
jgi:hypothetical protein